MTETDDEHKREVITSRIWDEIPEPDNPFAARACYCSGYDVYGDLLGKASWVEYLYLLFKLEPPTKGQAKLLEGLAVALANPGLRDYSVRAAMSAGAGGSTHASALIAAVAVGAGNLGGGREVFHAVGMWHTCQTDLQQWHETIANPPRLGVDVWQPLEHVPGFDPNGVSCATPVKQTLDYLANLSDGEALPWLRANREALEKAVEYPLAMSGVAAAALVDLDFSQEQSEMLYLLLRLPGAAAHALEQEKLGWRRYPFFGDGLILTNDPGKTGQTEAGEG